MRRPALPAAMLFSTVLAACASSSPGGETVIEGPPPQIRTVEVPVYVQQARSTPPKDIAPPRPRDPLRA